jgi:hypothetical protein
MRQYQIWIMIALLAIIAGVIVYANFKGEKTTEIETPVLTEE